MRVSPGRGVQYIFYSKTRSFNLVQIRDPKVTHFPFMFLFSEFFWMISLVFSIKFLF